MIPKFTQDGTLPAGIHDATLIEFEQRFSTNLKRKNLFQGLLKLVVDLKTINCKAIYVDGSYVTNKYSPNDIDVCWENAGIDLNVVSMVMPILLCGPGARQAQNRIYGADVFPAHFIETGSNKLFLDFFQTDKIGNDKGIIKIDIQ